MTLKTCVRVERMRNVCIEARTVYQAAVVFSVDETGKSRRVISQIESFDAYF